MFADYRINVYTEEIVYCWLRLEEDGEDLCILPCDEDAIGECEWKDSGEYDLDWEYELCGGGRWLAEPSGEGWDFRAKVYQFALQEGLCPGQDFLATCTKPRWYNCGGYEYPDEWDCEVDIDIFWVEPMPLEEHLARWQRWLDWRKGWLEDQVERMRELKHRQKTDTSAMYLKWEPFWSSSGYCDYLPDAIRACLCTTVTRLEGLEKSGAYCLAAGEDNSGRNEVAMANLVKRAAELLPHLTEDFIRNLPRRRCL